jgi:hypothetical protein
MSKPSMERWKNAALDAVTPSTEGKALGKKYSYLRRHPGLNDPEGLKAPPLQNKRVTGARDESFSRRSIRGDVVFAAKRIPRTRRCGLFGPVDNRCRHVEINLCSAVPGPGHAEFATHLAGALAHSR